MSGIDRIFERLQSLIGMNGGGTVASQLGVSADIIARYVNGQVPDPITIVQLADVGNVSIDWLLGGGPDPRKNGKALEEAGVSGRGSKRFIPPAVNRILGHPTLVALEGRVNGALLTQYVREVIGEWVKERHISEDPLSDIAAAVDRRARGQLPPPRAYLNATGIIIHTGWGNAPLHPTARDRLLDASGVTPTGAVGAPARTAHCTKLLRALTGAESASVTTLNAGSLLSVAGALSCGREIVAAARDLVEISEGVRLLDILQAVGARIVAVGSANCVNIDDYRRAINSETAMIMRIHASNMATSGYVEHVASPTLGELAHENGLLFVENLGGGSLVDLGEKGLPWCPTLQGAVTDGADLVLASADKIIGGPQAGIIVGKKSIVSRVSHHPIARTCRPGKLTLAALEATLAVYLGGRAWSEIPTLRLLNTKLDLLHGRAESLIERLTQYGYEASVAPDTAECGGAVLPGVHLPTWVVRIGHPRLKEDQIHAILYARGVVSRRAQGAVLLDLRSVLPEQDSLLLDAVCPSTMPA